MLSAIHAIDDGTDWNYYLQDGLGSVRAIVDDAAVVQSSMSYDPYGNPIGSYGTGFGFTGEQTDENDNIYLRARYYEPGMGTFSALDPFEGVHDRAMSLNGYSWVEGNPVMNVDPSGLVFWGFPSRTKKETMLVPGFYGIDTSQPYTKRCHGLYDGAWVARWLEENNKRLSGNDGLWNTLLEFPARGKRIDALVIEDVSFLSNPSTQIATGNGYVYEFEPISLTTIAKGYSQVLNNLGYMQAGIAPHSHKGNLTANDSWINQRPISHLGEPYDWTQVDWQLAPYLSPTHGRGPVRIEPKLLGGPTVPEKYWAFMPVDGLVLHISDCELKRRGEATTAAAAAAFLLSRYNKARDDYNDRYGGGNMPSVPDNVIEFPNTQPGGEVNQPAAFSIPDYSLEFENPFITFCSWLNRGTCPQEQVRTIRYAAGAIGIGIGLGLLASGGGGGGGGGDLLTPVAQ